MSFTPRSYEDIVRDLLTTLTNGTVREQVGIVEDSGEIYTKKLKSRPVRRVSYIEEIRTDEEGLKKRIRYTPADYELIASGDDGDTHDTIHFRKGKQTPLANSVVEVNYYPVQVQPSALTDCNVGSVTRTLMETFARQLALTELSLKHIYESAFLETATGRALDKIVALMGIRRIPSGHPTVSVLFTRAPGTSGRITIPANTVITNDKGDRYKTLQTLVLESYEQSREVTASGETSGTGAVTEKELNRLETVIAGISRVNNLKPSSKRSAPESDNDLRLRASHALHGIMGGTYNALKYGILGIAGVKSVSINEFPHGIAGEIGIEVSYSEDSPEVRTKVSEKIKELRPAGIRVIQSEASKKIITVHIEFVMAGSGLIAEELEQVKSSIQNNIESYLSHIAPGGIARQAKMVSLILADERIIDAHISLVPETGEAAESLILEDNQVFDVQTPFVFTKISAEEEAALQARTSNVTAFLPIHLQAGITEIEARSAIDTALAAYLSTRSATAPLSVDTMVAALRDETRYVIIRSEATITIEVDTDFMQLSDGLGEYIPQNNETIQKEALTVDVQEGNGV